MAGLGKELILDTALMLVAVLIAGRLRRINFGPLPVAVMKLCAIAIAPDAAGVLLMPLAVLIPILGGLGVWVVCFCLYFALIGALFDLDQSDTWYCVCVIFLVNLGAFFLWLYLL
jgi:hypothetical protein